MIQSVMKSGNLERIEVQTDDDSIGFYLKCGFTEERTVVDYPEGSFVHYFCVLNLKKYLFDKILECRNCFSSMFFIYHIDHEINQSKSDDGFYKAFDSWFEKNIIKTSNKKVK